MTKREIRNVAASVRARLLNHARKHRIEFNLVLRRFFFERFLYRLSKSDVRDRFVLKGAMLLQIWSATPYRATVDLDLLRKGPSNRDAIRDDLRAVLALEVEPDDGTQFDAESIRIEELRTDEEYIGFRITLVASLGVARDRLQIDIGTGDAAWPRPTRQKYPVVLDLPTPMVLAYRPESVVAEKLHAIVRLGMKNSRIKDYFDIHYIASTFGFDGATLREAVQRTFERRGTIVSSDFPIGLTEEYWADDARAAQLRAFARRARLDVDLANAARLIPLLQEYLGPILASLAKKAEFAGSWNPGGPWQTKAK